MDQTNINLKWFKQDNEFRPVLERLYIGWNGNTLHLSCLFSNPDTVFQY